MFIKLALLQRATRLAQTTNGMAKRSSVASARSPRNEDMADLPPPHAPREDKADKRDQCPQCGPATVIVVGGSYGIENGMRHYRRCICGESWTYDVPHGTAGRAWAEKSGSAGLRRDEEGR